MSWFSDLFKGAKKTNLTPNISMPKQEDLYHTAQLRDLTSRRLAGNDLGFGNDFVDKASNPEIQQLNQSFMTETMPFLTSQLSKRGVARSSGAGLATDILGGAEYQKNLDVASTIGKYYQLNEAQKKADFGQALGQANTMQNQQAGMKEAEALASERLANATAADSRYRQSYQDQKMNQYGQAAMMALPAVGGGLGAIGGSIGGPAGGMLSSLGKGATEVGQAYRSMQTSPTTFDAIGRLKSSGLSEDYAGLLSQLVAEAIAKSKSGGR